MRINAVYVLAACLFLTAITVVKVRHQHRLANVDFQAQKKQHDFLVDEWGQLLTEENLWSFPHRIEKDARAQLAMKKPGSEDIVYLDLDSPVESAENPLALQEGQ